MPFFMGFTGVEGPNISSRPITYLLLEINIPTLTIKNDLRTFESYYNYSASINHQPKQQKNK